MIPTPDLKKLQIDVARAAWSADLPDWVQVLAETCDTLGQQAAAQRIGMSGSVVNETLRNKYKGRLDRVAERVKGALMGKTVTCPVLGDDLPRNRCIELQGRPFAATNPERVQLFRTCPTCSNWRGHKAAPASPTSSATDSQQPEE
ncbi:MAG: transcriptional regulator [Reyranella sp.]|nr:transcriptional regulator [Reyranella sp.]